METRFILAFLLLVASCFGQAPAGMSARLKVELEDKYRYAPLPAVVTSDQAAIPEDETIVQLEPFTVTAFNSFRHDVGEAARRAADAKEAAKFSPLKGGLILAEQFGAVELKLGIWPMLIPYPGDSLAKPGMRLSVDVIRLNW